MGWLDKGNPRATRASVIRWAWIGGVGGCIVCLALLSWHRPAAWVWCLAVPVVPAFSAAIMALIEWQVEQC